MVTANFSRNIKLNNKKLFESVVNLGNLTVPCVAFLYTKGQIIDFGTSSALKKMKSSFQCTCQCTCPAQNMKSWEETLKDDQIKLITSETRAFDVREIEEKKLDFFFLLFFLAIILHNLGKFWLCLCLKCMQYVDKKMSLRLVILNI